MTFPVSDKPAHHVVCSQSHINKWPVFSLGELCRIIGGGTPSKKNPEFYSGDIPWVTVKDFGDTVIRDTIDHITEEAVERSATNLVPANTVLVVTRVGLGKVAITGRDMAINQDIKALFPDKRVLPEYLFWFLVSKSEEIERMGTGATVKGITLKQLKSLSVPLPSHTEQRRIVDILKRADSIRRLRKQAIDTARQLIPALFIDMFGDPATNPREWPRQNLGDLVVLRSGGTPSKKQAGYWGGNIPWISPKDMKTDVITDSIDHVTEKALLETSLKEIPPKSVLIVVRGMILAHTVPIALTLAKVTINQDMKAMIPCDLISPVYLKWTLQSMHSHLLSKVTTSAHGTRKLDTNRVLETPIPTPPMELQSDFTSKAKDIHSIIAQHKAALHKSEQIFQSILDDVFGSLRQAANAQPGL